MLRAGVPLVWFDRRSGHVVTFPEAAADPGWAEALATLVKDGRARSVEVKKLNGENLVPGGEPAAALRGAGFVESYRGFVVRS